jgi:subtilase family serine protease
VLGPGETAGGGVFFIEPNQLPPGTYPMTFTVDPDHKIAETDETNNDASVTVAVLPSNLGSGQPDLTISQIAMLAPPQNHCQNDEIEVSLKNQGTGFAYIRTGVLLATRPKAYEPEYYTGIAVYILPGETTKLKLKGTRPLPVLPGSYADTIQADPMNTVAESDESNNQYVYAWTMPAPPTGTLPDLVVTGVTFDPPAPTSQDRVMITVNMGNRGAGSAYICTGTTEWMARTVNGRGPGGGGVHVAGTPRVIAPGSTFFGGVYLNSPGQFPAGTYQIQVSVDPDGKVPETDEGNNSVTSTLVIR